MLVLKVLGRLRFSHILADFQLFLLHFGLVLKQRGKMEKQLKYKKYWNLFLIKLLLLLLKEVKILQLT